jgi:hypothetical protein
MNIFLIWQECTVDGAQEIIGYCKTKEEALKTLNNLRSLGYALSKQYSYWYEDIEEMMDF